MNATRVQTRVLPWVCPQVLGRQWQLPPPCACDVRPLSAAGRPAPRLPTLAAAAAAAAAGAAAAGAAGPRAAAGGGGCRNRTSARVLAVGVGHAAHNSSNYDDWQEATGQVVSTGTKYVRVHLHPRPAAAAAAAAATAAPPGAPSPPLQQPPRPQLLCTVRALLRKMQQTVLVGDQVTVTTPDWAAGRGTVAEVAPRSSELTDPAVANVDRVVLVFGLTQPPFEEVQVARFLVSLAASGLPLTLVLNKADLVPPHEVAARLAQVASWGYPGVAVSCATGQGLTVLEAALAGATSVVAGPSGAGKSSLINALRRGRHRPDAARCLAAEEEAAAAEQHGRAEAAAGPTPTPTPTLTHRHDHHRRHHAEGAEGPGSGAGSGGSGDLRGQQRRGTWLDASDFLTVGEMSRIGRGMHTTRSVTLVTLPGGGRIADTPGFGLPTLDAVSSRRLGELFPEFEAAAAAAGRRCRFDDCLHVSEPGCVVREAALERHPYYLKFLAEIKDREGGDERSMQASKRARQGVARAVSAKGGVTRYEARLEPKRYRGVSRRRQKQQLQQEDEEELTLQ